MKYNEIEVGILVCDLFEVVSYTCESEVLVILLANQRNNQHFILYSIYTICTAGSVPISKDTVDLYAYIQLFMLEIHLRQSQQLKERRYQCFGCCIAMVASPFRFPFKYKTLLG